MTAWLLAAHVAVLGYWLGSELVINATYRFVCFSGDMNFQDRDRLMQHVMHVDQHVRYALVLQVTLGVALAGANGFVPGGNALVLAAAIAGVFWLLFVEAVHRLRNQPVGKHLASIDRGSRYILMVILLGFAAGLLGGNWPLPDWLKWKAAAFTGVMACGVGIRLALIKHFKVWARMADTGVTPDANDIVKATYVQATRILIGLWMFIAIIVWLSLAKPV